jgi:peptidoglycan biosynthesis protein MviN/MurJ (putative lipid II flippase)
MDMLKAMGDSFREKADTGAALFASVAEGKLLFACAVMCATLWWLGGDLASWTQADSLNRIGRLVIAVSAGAVVYFAILWLSGLRLRTLHKPRV